MDEFAMGSLNTFSHTGPCLHPSYLDGSPATSPGGSSGGSAVAVASYQSYGALGSDTGGSVRLPAAWNMLVGLKPSYGLCSRYGLVSYASSLDVPSIFSRTVGDSALILDVIAGPDQKDSTSLDLPAQHYVEAITQSSDHTDMVIGIPSEYNCEELSSTIRGVWERAIHKLAAKGATIKTISLPHTPYALACYYIIAPAEAASNLSRYDGVRYGSQANPTIGDSSRSLLADTRDEGFGEEVKRRILTGNFVLSASAYEDYYVKAAKLRNLVKSDFICAFKDVDIIVTPCNIGPPPTLADLQKSVNPVEAYLNDVMTIPASLAGLPAISVPFEGQGIQVLANRFQEKSLFTIASLLEK